MIRHSDGCESVTRQSTQFDRSVFVGNDQEPADYRLAKVDSINHTSRSELSDELCKKQKSSYINPIC
ncbi:hypothetical protein CU102_19840 [Phyllobacterium brassicacearum]|uniref:Uncharacterized protein n=1 Tax=Phyllobacterium brassicacearum TaxID=314235 RepID=A0A2P7BGW4_9HYPH|nr:hypothetical protein CU102_19840 [Phyllobacterium brassicacearum]